MVRTGLILLILNCCLGFIIYTPRSSDPFTGVEVYSVSGGGMHPQKYPIDATRFGKNYSMFAQPGFATCGTPTGLPSSDLSKYALFGFYNGCSGSARLRRQTIWTPLNLGAMILAFPVYYADIMGNLYDLGDNDANSVQAALPILNFRYLLDPYQGLGSPNQDMTFVLLTYVATYGVNTTVYLSSAFPNLTIEAMNNPSSYLGFVKWFISTLGILCLIISCCQYVIFYFHEGKIQPSLPQLVLSLCAVGSVFIIISYLFGPVNQYLMNDGAGLFLVYFWTPWLYSAVVIMGFYYSEIATLTSAQRISGIDKMIIPAIIVISSVFIVIILIGGLVTKSPPGTNFVSIQTAQCAALLAICGLISIFFFWCVLILLLSLFKTRSAAITKVVISGSITFLSMAGLGIASWVLYLGVNPGGAFAIFGFFGNIYGLATVFLILGLHATTLCLSLALVFRVSVQKEIEISKSATSSTSSRTGSSSSSSSTTSGSSKSVDPVIEL